MSLLICTIHLSNFITQTQPGLWHLICAPLCSLLIIGHVPPVSTVLHYRIIAQCSLEKKEQICDRPAQINVAVFL